MTLDLLVAGGGPAGLATALGAARAGLRVAVVEPRETPVAKACGEGLMPAGLARLHALGVHPDGQVFTGIRYLSGRHEAFASFPHGSGLGVARTELQQRLASAAAAAGVITLRGRVREISQETEHVRTLIGAAGKLEPSLVTSLYLVGADGLHSTVRRLTGLEVPAHDRRRFGLSAHVSSPAHHPGHEVRVYWNDVAEAYLTPVTEDLFNLAVLTAHRADWSTHLQGFPALAGLRPVDKVRGAGPLRQRSRARVSGRVALVGDASGYVDAVTGEGISIALAQAEAVTAAVCARDLGRYEQDWHRIARAEKVVTQLLVGATRARVVRRALVPAASALPVVFRQAVALIAG